MQPPGLSSEPVIDETVRGRLVFEGSLVGLLFEDQPPVAYDLHWEEAYTLFPELREKLTLPVQWREEVIRSWHAEAPMVGGEVTTRIVLDIENVKVGRDIRLIYPIELEGHPRRAVFRWIQ